MELRDRYKPSALIIGGSEGIGAALARHLASSGFDLVLVARKSEPLQLLQTELRQSHPDRMIKPLSVDMSQPSGAEQVIDATSDLDIGLMIYNAGACSQRLDFVESEFQFHNGLIHLNIVNLLRLTHHYGRAMKLSGSGGLLLTGSLSSVAGQPGFSTYCGSKAFIGLFAEALWHELRPFNVDVLCYVLPGVATPAMARAFPASIGKGLDPAYVAGQALSHMTLGPILYGEGVEELRQSLAPMTRDKAVETLFARASAYK